MDREIEKVKKLASEVKDSYPDFVSAMVNGAKRHNVAQSMIDFMESNEGIDTDGVFEHYFSITILSDETRE